MNDGTWRTLTAPACIWLAVLFTLAIICSSDGWAANFAVNVDVDTHDLIPGDGICTDPNGDCSLRAALEEANANGSVDTIRFTEGVASIPLALGPLEIAGDSTSIIAHHVVVDGAYLLPYQSSMVITGDYNQLIGLEFYRARKFGVEVYSRGNKIDSCIFLKCGVESSDGGGLLLSGDSAGENIVTNSWFGIGGNGTQSDGNRAGIMLASGASGNQIGHVGEQNIISGNLTWGVEVLDGHDNQIISCLIGPDLSETNGPGNTLGGVRIADGARRNIIGGSLDGAGNVIAYNAGDGVLIEGVGTDSTMVLGNIVGLQPSGNLLAPNFQYGVRIADGAQYTVIGGTATGEKNLISGNGLDGVRVSGDGTRHTVVRNNFIGTDQSGFAGRNNGWIDGDGIAIVNGASFTEIGGAEDGEGNVISGNYRFGVQISGLGTSNNVVAGNLIGAAADGGSPVPNGTGIGMLDGASYNVIGGAVAGSGNIISGNREDVFPFGAGVVISGSGTVGNRISGNIVGMDITASVRMRNQSSGIIIGNGAQENIIGGTTVEERNIISGNGSDTVVADLGRGIHIFGEGTARNVVCGNWIGVGYDGKLKMPNRGIGISVTDGARDCLIGGDQPEAGNRICFNRGHGILVSGSNSSGVSIRHDEIFANDSLGIAIRSGAQHGIGAPHLTSATPASVSGTNAPPLAVVDIYLAATDPSGTGEGRQLIGTGQADFEGNFDIAAIGVSETDTITAVATDRDGNTSAFATNIGVGVASDAGNLGNAGLPSEFSLSQNYPNPFNPSTVIAFSLSQRGQVGLEVFSALGRRVCRLIDDVRAAGQYVIVWDGRDDDGKAVASGTYFYRLVTSSGTISKKMLLLR